MGQIIMMVGDQAPRTRRDVMRDWMVLMFALAVICVCSRLRSPHRGSATSPDRLENRAFLALALTIMVGTIGAFCASTVLLALAGALFGGWVALHIAARAEGRR